MFQVEEVVIIEPEDREKEEAPKADGEVGEAADTGGHFVDVLEDYRVCLEGHVEDAVDESQVGG